MTKNLYTIPPDVAFLDALAEGLWQAAQGDVFKLTAGLILLPTRRACRHLRAAFLRRMDKNAALLPRMQPLGDIDEEEFYFAGDQDLNPALLPAITPLRRQLLLTRLIRAKDAAMPLDQAAQLAEALALFLDQVQIERCDLSKLEQLVQEKDLAEHWRQTVKFLEILTDAWPKMLAEEGCIDPADRRNRVLEAQAAAWRDRPPKHPVIAAGSTGSMPATRELLDVIASMPQGAVILPGLDQALDEEAWQAINETHPQFGIKQLIEKIGVKRVDVKLWSINSSPPLAGSNPQGFDARRDWVRGGVQKEAPSPAKTKDLLRKSRFLLPLPRGERENNARMRLLGESMRPAEVTEAWRHLKPADIPETALAGLSRIELDHPQEEAQVIALLLREVLETPDKTAALVTSDRLLAERVAALLLRWRIAANDSGGASLATQPAGSFLLDVLAAAAPQAASVDYLSLLKHPLTACGLSLAECRSQARQVEVNVWRSEKPETSEWLDGLKQKFQPVTATWQKPLPLMERIRTHIQLAEQLATSDQEKGADRLWQGDNGNTAVEWLADWQDAAADFPLLTGEEYIGLFGELLSTVTLRSTYGQHPRLSILGPLEARLIQADVMVLGGLNEGSWPPEAPVDPWMSRPMKKSFGLPSPERRIGLSAHDFVQLASAPEVVLTRSKRAGNAPTVPSRFLLQLETVLRALGYSDDKRDALLPQQPWHLWARMLDEPTEIAPCDAPQPKPPQESRPTQLSVTEIGTWRRNPYAIYAKHILKLRKLDPLDAEIDAADRGSMIHEALDVFVKAHPDTLPANALDQLLKTGRKIFAAYDEHPEVKAFWWPRFERIAAWFIDHERERRASGIKVLQAEAKGRMNIGHFTLKGRADRIDTLPDGTLAITDYKTGGVPSQKEVKAGYEPQLPLLALIAEHGGFDKVGKTAVMELAYWKLSGGRDVAKEFPINEPVAKLAEEARAGLEQLTEKFSDPATPYQAVPKPRLQPRFDDYAHLARLAEWGRTGEDE